MAFNGTGTFLRLYSWATDKINSIPITASRVDAEMDGMATGLSNCITKDGQTTISANIPFNSFKATGLGVGTARTDAITVGQVQDNQFLYLGTTSGTADAYTLAPSPAITAYTATQQFTAKISATNLTTTPYLQVSAIANPASTAVIKKLDATKAEIALEPSDLIANGLYKFQRNSANDAWIALNPSKPKDLLATTTTQGIAFLSNPITISNNATDANNDIDFSAGNFQFSDGSGQATYAGGTGQLDVLFGTGNGMLATGTKAINSTYHLYMVSNLTTGVSKPLAILGVAGTAPDPTSVLPSGYTKFKRIASILTDGSGNIRNASYTFFLGGYYCNFNGYIADAVGVSLSTLRDSLNITTPKGIATLANVHPYFDITNARENIEIFEGGTSKPYFYIRGGASTIANTQAGGNNFVKTNISSQIDWKTTVATISVSLLTNGFTDYTN